MTMGLKHKVYLSIRRYSTSIIIVIFIAYSRRCFHLRSQAFIVLDTLETKEVTEQIDQRAKQPPQVESVEELETLPAGTEPRTSHHGSPGGERRRPRQRPTIFLERARKGHRQSDQLWNCFKGNVGETPERRGGSHMDLPERIYTTWN